MNYDLTKRSSLQIYSDYFRHSTPREKMDFLCDLDSDRNTPEMDNNNLQAAKVAAADDNSLVRMIALNEIAVRTALRRPETAEYALEVIQIAAEHETYGLVAVDKVLEVRPDLIGRALAIAQYIAERPTTCQNKTYKHEAIKMLASGVFVNSDLAENYLSLAIKAAAEEVFEVNSAGRLLAGTIVTKKPDLAARFAQPVPN